LKRKIAAEMNLSETAFVTIENGETFEKSSKFALRWFTPTHEVDLCGHVMHIICSFFQLDCRFVYKFFLFYSGYTCNSCYHFSQTWYVKPNLNDQSFIINQHIQSYLSPFYIIGNKEKAIEFNTLSGILKAIQENDSSITLDFPLNPSSPYEAQNLKDIIRVVANNFEIQDVQHCSTTKKLLLRLADKYKRFVLFTP
jgi:hypothetical protein